MKIQMIVETVNGSVHTSSFQDYSEEEVAGLVNVLKNMKSVTHFSIGTEAGARQFFNPEHVVSVSLLVEKVGGNPHD